MRPRRLPRRCASETGGPSAMSVGSATRLDPGVIAREHLEGGKTVIRTYVPCAESMFTFPPSNWRLAQLFDGSRSYEEIAEMYSQQTGAEYSAEEVREFASNLDAIDFWYSHALERGWSRYRGVLQLLEQNLW